MKPHVYAFPQPDVGTPSTNDVPVYEDSVEGDTSLYDESHHRGVGCLSIVLESLSEKPPQRKSRSRRRPAGHPLGKPEAGASLFVSVPTPQWDSMGPRHPPLDDLHVPPKKYCHDGPPTLHTFEIWTKFRDGTCPYPWLTSN